MEQWIWIIVLVVALIVEVATAGTLVSIWFAIGSAVAYLSRLLNAPFFLQVIIFLVVSTIALLAIRPLASTYFRGNIVATNADRIIGAQATLTKAISAKHWGEINMYGLVWSVVERDNRFLEAGTQVRVIAIEGAKLIVEEIK
ncbi:MAG: NfeD family protein [Erysipelothrix sp.]|jgi:membrane protein implicated in regulation of membrane protease activity|nr:NfeD family protein [Erysipelothrix sp.]